MRNQNDDEILDFVEWTNDKVNNYILLFFSIILSLFLFC